MNAFQMMMNQKQIQQDNKTKTGYSILKGSDKTNEDSCYLLQFDGLSQPNPGTSTAGAVIFSPCFEEQQRKPVHERGEFIHYATNNQAEYTGLLIGLKAAVELNIKHLLIEGDSQLVIYQTEGKWKVANDALKVLHAEIKALLASFDFVAIRHVRREYNKYADKITNDVLESKQSFSRNIQI